MAANRHTPANAYDTPIELRRRTLAPNETGERVPSWPVAYATVWAKRVDVAGNKRFVAQSTGYDQLVTFTIRHRPDLLPTDHIFIKADGTEHEIRQIADVGRNEEKDILARRLTT